MLLKVLEAPDDDEPRLVYADLLQERGDVRGEFIPLQCALARPQARSDPGRFAQMRARESELLSAHSISWTAQAIPFSCGAEFRRGFVEEVQCLPGELLRRGLEVVAPVRALRLDGDTSAEVAQRVLALPVGSRVQELALRLVESAVDASLKSVGPGLVALRQLSADANSIHLLAELGWLWRLQRLELPMDLGGHTLLEDLARLKPPQLKLLWLHRQADQYAEAALLAMDQVFAALPEVTIRWRGTDYQASEAKALRAAVNPPASQAQLALRPRETKPYPWVVAGERAPARPAQSPRSDAPPAAVAVVPTERPFSPTVPWDRWLRAEGLQPRGFVPRMLTGRFALLRALEGGVPVLVAVGPATDAGSLRFAEDVALALRLKSPHLLGFVRNGTTEAEPTEGEAEVAPLPAPAADHDRVAVSEPFEGVTLWELQQLHRRLEPKCVLRIVCQVARAAVELPWWEPSADDVLIDALGAVKLLSGFPASVTELHRLGTPLEDTTAPGARVSQLGTALFELLTGTALFDFAPRSTQVLDNDRAQQLRPLELTKLTLGSVDASLARLDKLLAKAVTHAHHERFAGLAEFATALDVHPETGDAEDLAPLVRDALARTPRTRDGR